MTVVPRVLKGTDAVVFWFWPKGDSEVKQMGNSGQAEYFVAKKERTHSMGRGFKEP